VTSPVALCQPISSMRFADLYLDTVQLLKLDYSSIYTSVNPFLIVCRKYICAGPPLASINKFSGPLQYAKTLHRRIVWLQKVSGSSICFPGWLSRVSILLLGKHGTIESGGVRLDIDHLNLQSWSGPLYVIPPQTSDIQILLLDAVHTVSEP
jgi:hypothetical protein